MNMKFQQIPGLSIHNLLKYYNKNTSTRTPNFKADKRRAITTSIILKQDDPER